MGIVGIGIDVANIARFEATLQRTPGLRDRLFTPAERGLAMQSLAARFAAKEALAKALATEGGLNWHDAEVVQEPSGRPTLRITGTVAARAAQLGVTKLHLSLSHDAGIASAIVIAES
jgi:holo-[acyl-carrier protein] synthase